MDKFLNTLAEQWSIWMLQHTYVLQTIQLTDIWNPRYPDTHSTSTIIFLRMQAYPIQNEYQMSIKLFRLTINDI